MTSEAPRDAFAWVWLPGAATPVVAGRLHEEGGVVSFAYGASYLARDDAISLYAPELPLRRGTIWPLPELAAPGCIVDAGPDAWGQRVIMAKLMGAAARQADPAELGTLTYLLESGSDRIGALDFQASPDVYVPRATDRASLDDLARAAELFDAGEPLPAYLGRRDADAHPRV